jgi:hypothetical protein
MSKSRTGWLLAICLCIPLAACVVGPEEELEDAEVAADEVAVEEAEPAALEATTSDCQFSVQCDPCEPPWVQQTAQRTWDSCGASGPMWSIEFYCALCD